MGKKKIFGLDISDNSIEALILTKPLFGKAKVAAYARTVLRGKQVINGAIKDKKKLSDSIIKVLASAKPKPIKSPYCIVSIPESQVFTTIFKLPAGLKEKEIKNTVPVKAEEVIPFKSNEVYFDFKVISKSKDIQEVFYVAVPSKVINDYVEVLQASNLTPIAFDLESISLSRAVMGFKQKHGKGKLIMDIGARTTNLNIFDRNGIRQSITIRIAGDRFTKAVAKSLNQPEKEADKIKIKSGFDSTKENGKVVLALQNEFKRILAETKKAVEFYQVESQRQIDQVILAGGSAMLPKIDQYLADNLSIEAVIANPLTKVSDPKNLAGLKNNAVLFSNVAGLALRAIGKNPVEDDINLLPVITRGFSIVPPKTDKRSWFWVYTRLGVLITLAIILGVLYRLKINNIDVVGNFIPSTDSSNYELNIDQNVLDQLRSMVESSTTPTTTATTTATTTEELATSTPTVVIKEAPEQPRVVEVIPTTLGYLNMRSGAGISFAKVAQVDSGTQVTVLKEENGWLQIELADGSSGWVSSAYVKDVADSN